MDYNSLVTFLWVLSLTYMVTTALAIAVVVFACVLVWRFAGKKLEQTAAAVPLAYEAIVYSQLPIEAISKWNSI